MVAKETPIGIALILCDLIILDAATQKRSLIGLFNSVNSTEFPAVIPKLCILASITQINGSVNLRLDATNEHTGELVISIPATAQAPDPNGVLDLAFEFQNFSFPKPGLYSFEVHGDDAIILSTRVNVLEIPRKTIDPGGPQ